MRSRVHLDVSDAAAEPRLIPRPARLGDELARCEPVLRGLAWRITRDEDAAADVVQRAFVKVLVHIGRFEGRSALRTWVRRIAANEALAWRRERQRRERRLASAAAAELRSDRTPSPLEALERDREIARVRGALAALGSRDREIVQQTLDADRSAIAQLSGRTGVCARTLRTRLHRARRRLRRLLEEQP